MDYKWFLFLAGRTAVADATALIGRKTQRSSFYVQFGTYLDGRDLFLKPVKM